eukprot:763241-Hanusia_phi.AAC.8
MAQRRGEHVGMGLVVEEEVLRHRYEDEDEDEDEDEALGRSRRVFVVSSLLDGSPAQRSGEVEEERERRGKGERIGRGGGRCRRRRTDVGDLLTDRGGRCVGRRHNLGADSGKRSRSEEELVSEGDAGVAVTVRSGDAPAGRIEDQGRRAEFADQEDTSLTSQGRERRKVSCRASCDGKDSEKSELAPSWPDFLIGLPVRQTCSEERSGARIQRSNRSSASTDAVTTWSRVSGVKVTRRLLLSTVIDSFSSSSHLIVSRQILDRQYQRDVQNLQFEVTRFSPRQHAHEIAAAREEQEIFAAQVRQGRTLPQARVCCLREPSLEARVAGAQERRRPPHACTACLPSCLDRLALPSCLDRLALPSCLDRLALPSCLDRLAAGHRGTHEAAVCSRFVLPTLLTCLTLDQIQVLSLSATAFPSRLTGPSPGIVLIAFNS